MKQNMSYVKALNLESVLQLKTDWGNIVIWKRTNDTDPMKHAVELHSPVITWMHSNKLCPS